MNDLRTATAYHESGHAMAALVLGYPIKFIWIADMPRLGTTCGQCVYADLPTTERDKAIVMLAGDAAQRLACPGSPLTQRDFAQFTELVAHHSHKGWVGAGYLGDARGIVFENWDAVERLAKALLRDGTLTGQQARRLSCLDELKL